MNRLFASLTFFTRLPFWKIVNPKAEHYDSVVEYWPLVGWLTSAIMASVMYLTSFILPWHLAVIVGIMSRVFVTGALHEDGLADFADAFGAHADRQRTLEIMKDSHIGTFGVLALIFYYAVMWSILVFLTPLEAVFLIITADPYAKMISTQIIQMLPYARSAEQAKSKTIYRKISTASGLSLMVQGLLPGVVCYFIMQFYAIPLPHHTEWIIFLPCLTMYVLYLTMRKRIQGYTGDCCGAIFLLTELSIYLAWIIR